MADAQRLLNHLDHRRQTVGGAGGGGNNAVLLRVKAVLVDAHHHIQRARLLDRRTHHHPFDALIQIRLQARQVFHLAAGLDDQIAVAPVGIGQRAIGRNRDRFALDQHLLGVAAGLVLPAAVHRIKVEQVGVRRRVARRVIDAHKLQLWPVPGCAQRQATNATKTVDTYLDAHSGLLPCEVTLCLGTSDGCGWQRPPATA